MNDISPRAPKTSPAERAVHLNNVASRLVETHIQLAEIDKESHFLFDADIYPSSTGARTLKLEIDGRRYIFLLQDRTSQVELDNLLDASHRVVERIFSRITELQGKIDPAITHPLVDTMTEAMKLASPSKADLSI